MLKVYCGDSRIIIPKEIKSNSIDLVFTSPPYNTGKSEFYDIWNDNLSDNDYISLLLDIIRHCELVLKNGGHLILNLPPMVNRNPPRPYVFHLVSKMESLRILKLVGLKIWWKKEAGKNNIAVGSRYNKPYPLDDCEFLIIWRKGDEDRNGIPGLAPDKEMQKLLIRSWVVDSTPLEILPETNQKNRKGHPAVFPLELPKRIIELFTREGETVLDPFAGIGTTLKACKELNRSSIAIEISSDYVKFIKNIINQKIIEKFL